MKALIKFLLWTVALLVVLIVAAIIIVPLVVDPNDYKDEITAQVKKQTGRDLELSGDLALTVFPWLGVDMGEAKLGNAPGFGAEPMAAVGSAAVRVKLLPLLKKELEVDTIVLDGLVLNLEKNKSGVSNWDDLAKSDAPDKPAERSQPDGESSPIAALAIGGLNIRNAQVNWTDGSTGQTTTIKGLDIDTGALSPGKPAKVTVGFDLSGTEPQMAGRLDLSTIVNADLDAQRYELKDLSLKLGLSGEAVGGKSVAAQLAAQVAGNLADDSVTVGDLALSTGDLRLTGALKGSNVSNKPKFTGNAKLDEFNLRSVLADWGVALDTADASALKRAALSFDINASDSAFSANNLKMTLDDSTLSGRFAVADFASQALRFALTLDKIDLDRYLPPKSDTAPPADPATAAAGAATVFPVETLRGLNIDGKFSVGELKASGLTMGDAAITVKAKGGNISVSQTVGRLYGGASTAQASIDARGKTPKVALTESMKGVNIGPLLKDLTGEDRLSGTGRFEANIRSAGNTDAALKKALNGTLSFRFEDGAVKGVNIGKLLRETKSKLGGGTATASASEDDKTDFSELSASAKITNGILRSNDLSGKSPLLRVGGEGEVNIPAESVDYVLRTTIVGSLSGQGGEDLKKLKGVTIPVRAKGPFTQLAYSVDWGSVLTEKAKDELKGKARAKLDKLIEDEGGDGKKAAAGQLLKGFLGGDSSGEASASAADAGTAKEQPADSKEEAKPEDLLKGLFR